MTQKTNKQCPKCYKILPFSAFRQYRRICRECQKAQKREYYKKIKSGEVVPKKRVSVVIKDESVVTRKCSSCHQTKLLLEFPHNIKNPYKPRHWKSACRECCCAFQRKRLKEGYKRPSSLILEHRLTAQKRRSSHSRGHIFDIGVDHVRRLISTQTINSKLTCTVTGIPLSKGLSAPSLDRIFNDLGYVSGNVQIVCRFYNLAKNTHDDFEFKKILMNPIGCPIGPFQPVIKHLWRISSRRHGFSLKFSDIRAMLTSQTKDGVLYCAVTNMPLINHFGHPQSPSIDRIDNAKRYTKDNVRITSLLFNRGRNKYSHEEALGVYNTIKKSVGGQHTTILPLDSILDQEHLSKFDAVIYEDEWANKRDIITSILSNKKGRNNSPLSLRPQQCTIETIKPKLATKFYNKYHYIGGCPSKYHISMKYKDQIVACISLRKPIRQKAGDWEISRMATHRDYRIYGVWSYMMCYIKKLISGKLITYVDNRLFSGHVYSKLSMSIEHKVQPDYYWVRDGVRHHKSKMRKPKGEIKTENELRISQGYHKLYDVGKTKWSMIV